MFTKPFERRCEAVRKTNLTVQNLQDLTMETMFAWFNDPEHPGNLAKQPLLKEIFKAAKIEQEYESGKIGTFFNQENAVNTLTH
jgi:hypothetical protein